MMGGEAGFTDGSVILDPLGMNDDSILDQSIYTNCFLKQRHSWSGWRVKEGIERKYQNFLYTNFIICAFF